MKIICPECNGRCECEYLLKKPFYNEKGIYKDRKKEKCKTCGGKGFITKAGATPRPTAKRGE